MLLSYLKIAWKVLMRRKFFTAINLFGISFTLMILLVVMAMADNVVGNHAPEKRMDRMVFINALNQEMQDNHGWMNSPMGTYFVNTFVRTMKTPEIVGLTSFVENSTSFAHNKLLPLDSRYVDGNFWRIMEFDFLAGRGLTNAEVEQAQLVCVINEATARSYFGSVAAAVGHTIEIDLKPYRVAGVVPNVPASHPYSYADVWLPYSHHKFYHADHNYFGSYIPILLARSPDQVKAVREEFRQVMRRVPIEKPKEVKAMYAFADPALAGITRQLVGGSMEARNTTDSLGTFYLVVGGLALLFLLLPTLNLVNLNVTRILERSGEIGVRKAFGASGQALVGQFIVENLVLTTVGGLLGLGLAAGALALVNEAHAVAYAQFQLSWWVFGWGLVLTLLFGLMSGVYPAWKMSRLNPVAALRGSGEQK